MEFAKEERAKGKSIINSALKGLKERFRAVLMTAATFVLGVLPMIWATGAASNSRRAIGVPVFYGMLIGTILGLFVIPLFYVWIQTWAELFRNRKFKTFSGMGMNKTDSAQVGKNGCAS